MNRVAGAFLRVDNEYIGLHEKIPLPGKKTPGGHVRLANVMERFMRTGHRLNPHRSV